MKASAPRISPRLVATIASADDGSMPIAELCRRVGVEAERIGLPRPSYEQVRVLAHAARSAAQRPGPADLLAEVWLGPTPLRAANAYFAGTLARRKRTL